MLDRFARWLWLGAPPWLFVHLPAPVVTWAWNRDWRP
jgi:hypothetical protein